MTTASRIGRVMKRNIEYVRRYSSEKLVLCKECHKHGPPDLDKRWEAKRPTQQPCDVCGI